MALVIAKAGPYDQPHGYVLINGADGVTDGSDQIVGTDMVDHIYAGGGNDIIKGGGADIIDGGDGRDGATYEDSDVGVTVSLVTGKGHGGTAEGDTLISIEDLYGSKYDDKLTGNAGDNLLSGGDGNDMLKGGGGSDTLKGGAGDDVIQIDVIGDHVYGGEGNDTVIIDSAQGYKIDLRSGFIDNNPFWNGVGPHQKPWRAATVLAFSCTRKATSRSSPRSRTWSARSSTMRSTATTRPTTYPAATAMTC
jgi:Ca2+-binding RTX toxin-like protein